MVSPPLLNRLIYYKKRFISHLQKIALHPVHIALSVSLNKSFPLKAKLWLQIPIQDGSLLVPA
ncbi:unnamed protein product [Staurois parvus]|uniref:Uncharacterized protein n=1 Tax=Staurois parvus TaxID=386267 RepID=A0ABN9HST3_9NEOB|nr:unnamed protein product [Staurois parvus]